MADRRTIRFALPVVESRWRRGKPPVSAQLAMIIGPDGASREQGRRSAGRDIVQSSHISLLEPVKAEAPRR